MFNVKFKTSYIIALVLGVLGVTCLVLKVFKVLPSDNLYTLIALVFLLFAFALYLRPKMLLMKKQSQYLQLYREKVYTEMTKNCKNEYKETELTLYEDDNGVIHYGDVSFEGLSYKEFQYIMKELLKDFFIIVYGCGEKPSERYNSRVMEFTVKLKMKNGEIIESKIIDNYKIKK